MVGAFDGRVKEPLVARRAMMCNAHFDEIPHDVEFMIRHALEMRHIPQRCVAVDISARFLRGKNDRNPFLNLPAQKLLASLQLLIIARVEFKRQTCRLHNIVGIGVRPLTSLETTPGLLAAQFVAC